MLLSYYINFFCVIEVLRVLVKKKATSHSKDYYKESILLIYCISLHYNTPQYIPIPYNTLQYIETHYNILKDITLHYNISFNYNTHVKYLILYLYSLYITLILHCIPHMFLLIWRFGRLLHKKGLTGIFWSTLTGGIFG